MEAYPEAAGITNNYGNLALHFTAWKKGPLDVERMLLKVYPEGKYHCIRLHMYTLVTSCIPSSNVLLPFFTTLGAAQKNNHGNLPLHYAAHYNAPLEVVEALYNAYPEGALQKNNDNNTPLDLAIADGASPNVVALLQGKSVPPSDEELLIRHKARYEKMEKDLQSYMERHDSVHEDVSTVLEFLMDVKEAYPHALYCAGMDPEEIKDADSLVHQIRKAADGNMDRQQQEEVIPALDEVERQLDKIVGLEDIKHQVRGMRRTIELGRGILDGVERELPPHLYLVGSPGSGKTFVARILGEILWRIGAVKNDVFLEVGRTELVEATEAKTIEKTKKILRRAKGGILFVDEAYTLLPSAARRGIGQSDHGSAALRTIAEALPQNDPLVILAGYSSDLQVIITNNALGFKNSFLLQLELPDMAPDLMSRLFMAMAKSKGIVFAEGVTQDYVATLLERNTSLEWRSFRNGRVSEMLLNSVRRTIKMRNEKNLISSRGRSLSPARSVVPVLSPISHKLPVAAPEDVIATVEDLQQAIALGL